MQMKLSIITICYNIKDDIARTCESIVNQTWQDFEWIIVDGGSTDGTLEVLEKYKERINIFISEKDEGVFDAMNKGILRANGEYLNFMNGGDSFYQNNTLENCISYLTYSDIYYGNVYNNLTAETFIYQEYLPADYFLYSSIAHQSSFIRKELFIKYGLYNTVFGADIHKWIVFQKNACTFCYLNKIIANYQGGGISTQAFYYKVLNETKVKLFTNTEITSCTNLKKTQNVSIPYSIFSYRLLNFIPLLKKIIKNNKTTYYLFNTIPLLTIKFK